MSDVIPYSRDTDLSGLRLTQGRSGHVHSPFFTFDWETEWIKHPADCRSRYHSIIAQSKSAFTALLGIQENDVLVTERTDERTGERWWRLGTKNPTPLPKPRIETKSNKLQAGPPAIDI